MPVAPVGTDTEWAVCTFGRVCVELRKTQAGCDIECKIMILICSSQSSQL